MTKKRKEMDEGQLDKIISGVERIGTHETSSKCGGVDNHIKHGSTWQKLYHASGKGAGNGSGEIEE